MIDELTTHFFELGRERGDQITFDASHQRRHQFEDDVRQAHDAATLDHHDQFE